MTSAFPESLVPVHLIDRPARACACFNAGRVPRQCGLTFPELLMGVGLAALLTTLALSSLARVTAGNAVTGHVNSFLSDVRFARSEALKRGGSVTMCRSAEPETASPICGGAGGPGWETGWIVFVDFDSDNLRSRAEPLLRVQPALRDSGGIQRRGGGAYSHLRFKPTGLASAGQATLHFSPRSVVAQVDGTLKRTVCISIIGRARILPAGDDTC